LVFSCRWSPQWFEIICQLRSTLLRQLFLAATPDASDPAREEVR
jgi:hypothetical protein